MTKTADWTFLSNYAHVLVCLADNPAATIREIAVEVGITERSAMRLITQLDDAGIIRREKEGRRNHYLVDVNAPLRHPLEAHCTVGQLLEILLSADRMQRLRQEQVAGHRGHGLQHPGVAHTLPGQLVHEAQPRPGELPLSGQSRPGHAHPPGLAPPARARVGSMAD